MIHLVALDVDGTLLASDHTLPPRNTQAIRAAQARGIHICLATGKLYGSIAALVAPLALHGPQITCNGAVIRDAPSGAIMEQWPLTAAQLATSRSFLASHAPDLAIAWYTADAIFTDARPGPLDDILAAYHEPPVRHIASLHDPDLAPPVKLLITAPPVRLTEMRRIGEAEIGESVRVVRTAHEFLEFMNPAANKGVALDAVRELLGIARDQTLALGDSENDLPLLAAAGVGVAMANATPEVLAHADRVAPTNDAAGVAVILDELSRSAEDA